MKPHVSSHSWSDWRWQLRNRVCAVPELEGVVQLSDEERTALASRELRPRFAVTPYYLSLLDGRNPSCPIRRQCIPTPRELEVRPEELEDSLGEEENSPVEGIVHRYPDRALLYATHDCAAFCRHCTRKRKVSNPHSALSPRQLEEALAYVERTPSVRDVLVSGGDPLTLPDEQVLTLLHRLRSIEHVEIIRLCTRTPVTLPQRITPELVAGLSPLAPLFIQTHFNHPLECSTESATALRRLVRAGCTVGNQMVLLAGINDTFESVCTVNRWLLSHGVRPYYLLQCDMAPGLAHFRTRLEVGVDILARMRGKISGLGIPTFVVDLPGGAGKVPVSPDFILRRDDDGILFRSWRGESVYYRTPPP